MKRLNYFSKKQLKSEYGFTDFWIKRLGEPDRIGINEGAHLYSTKRVLTFIFSNILEFEKIRVAIYRINLSIGDLCGKEALDRALQHSPIDGHILKLIRRWDHLLWKELLEEWKD
jgi:hypothetical protein